MVVVLQLFGELFELCVQTGHFSVLGHRKTKSTQTWHFFLTEQDAELVLFLLFKNNRLFNGHVF